MSSLGVEVFVQLVMAAITTDPWVSSTSLPSIVARALASTAPGFGAFASIFSSDPWNEAFDSVSLTRSCGRAGPARLGTTVARSSERTSV
jgi:hypothetical protein